jgi:hypothetical protein
MLTHPEFLTLIQRTLTDDTDLEPNEVDHIIEHTTQCHECLAQQDLTDEKLKRFKRIFLMASDLTNADVVTDYEALAMSRLMLHLLAISRAPTSSTNASGQLDERFKGEAIPGPAGKTIDDVEYRTR